MEQAKKLDTPSCQYNQSLLLLSSDHLLWCVIQMTRAGRFVRYIFGSCNLHEPFSVINFPHATCINDFQPWISSVQIAWTIFICEFFPCNLHESFSIIYFLHVICMRDFQKFITSMQLAAGNFICIFYCCNLQDKFSCRIFSSSVVLQEYTNRLFPAAAVL